jgi:glutamate N-acetyltransferase/amino-acid N-acetyltransferase
MAKGAGMIHPNMGTLLSIICTDAPIVNNSLSVALQSAVEKSFNCISIDGDTSTNDTVAILANGAAAPGSRIHNNMPSSSKSNIGAYNAFVDELTTLCRDLAQLVVRDGEGATKFVTIRVLGAGSFGAGRAIASSVARSPLVKTALYGRDANWGRILCAIGYAGHGAGSELPKDEVVPDKVSVSFVPARGARKEGEESKHGELKLVLNGEPQVVDEVVAAEMLAEEDLEILVRLRPEGEVHKSSKPVKKEHEVGEVEYWTCDFSHEYITINGDYRT